MVLFDTIVDYMAIFAYRCGTNLTMANVKYSLFSAGRSSTVGTTDLKKREGNLIDPNGCTVLLVRSGYAVVSVNFRKWALRRGDMLILFYDDVMVMNERSALFSARFVSLDYALVENTICKMAASDFWHIHYYECPVHHASQQESQLLAGWWQQMQWFDKTGNGAHRNELLAGGFDLFMSAIDGVIAGLPSKPLPNTRSRRLIADFYKLLSRHCRQHRDVSFYADELCITTAYLYKICRKVLNSSPKAEIAQQTIFEIKTYLANTHLPIKRIAEELNFDDASYMCRYFRRITGISPADYRSSRSMKQ